MHTHKFPRWVSHKTPLVKLFICYARTFVRIKVNLFIPQKYRLSFLGLYLCICHRWQWWLNACHCGVYCQQSGHAQVDTSWSLCHQMNINITYIILLYRFMIYPEGKPGDNDNEHCWQVDCDDVEWNLSHEKQLHLWENNTFWIFLDSWKLIVIRTFRWSQGFI